MGRNKKKKARTLFIPKWNNRDYEDRKASNQGIKLSKRHKISTALDIWDVSDSISGSRYVCWGDRKADDARSSDS